MVPLREGPPVQLAAQGGSPVVSLSQVGAESLGSTGLSRVAMCLLKGAQPQPWGGSGGRDPRSPHRRAEGRGSPAIGPPALLWGREHSEEINRDPQKNRREGGSRHSGGGISVIKRVPHSCILLRAGALGMGDGVIWLRCLQLVLILEETTS